MRKCNNREKDKVRSNRKGATKRSTINKHRERTDVEIININICSNYKAVANNKKN